MTRTTPRHERPDADNEKEVSPAKKARRAAKTTTSPANVTDGAEGSSTPAAEPNVSSTGLENTPASTGMPNSLSSAVSARITPPVAGDGAAGGDGLSTTSVDTPSATDPATVGPSDSAAPSVPKVAAPKLQADLNSVTSTVHGSSSSPTVAGGSADTQLTMPSTPPGTIAHTAGIQSSPLRRSSAGGSTPSSAGASPVRSAVFSNKVSLHRPATTLPIRPVEPMSLDTRSYFDAADIESFDNLRLFSDASLASYAVGALPERLSWGAPARGNDDRRSFITEGHTKVKVYILGELLKLDEKVSPYGSRALLSMLPLVESDAMRLDELLTSFATSGAATTSNTWERGIWMSQLIPDKGQTMKAIYDARVEFRAKEGMATLGANDLNRNDIIFVEAYITRYQHHEDVVKVQRYKEDWSSVAYRISLELASISLVKTVPRT
ncbi:hypothetical protein QCA50_019367 [Cerrena zonata]|uniref:Uncharacterized protein n=1 Tax=Cerrena zonata TaxID=2478898 RepID=A0AAW0FBE7_9APHY